MSKQEKLTKEERRDLIKKIAVQIAPVIIQRNGSNSEISGNTVALFANDITDAVDRVLYDPSGSRN
jgi:hypothetical protein